MKKNQSLPRPHIKRLANGLTVIHLRTEHDPISAAHLFLPTGAAHEMEDRSGLTTLRWMLLSKSTRRHSARQMAENIESLGGSIGAGAAQDSSEISCHSVSDYFVPMLDILAEALFEPAFEKQEVEREKTALLASIASKKENIFTVAGERLQHTLYHNHPYGRPSTGIEQTVEALNEEQLHEWSQAITQPQNAILSIASNLSLSQLWPDIERLFGPKAWKKSAAALPVIPLASKLSEPSFITGEEPFEQAFLMMGFAAPAITDKSYPAIKMLNACLGGGMSARLFQQLREKEGLAYDVGAYYSVKKKGGAVIAYMGLQASRLKEAKKRMLEVLQDSVDLIIPEKEWDQTRRYMKGTYLLDHQTNSQRAHYLGWWQIMGKTPDFDAQYPGLLDRVTPAHGLSVARRLFTRPSIIVEIIPNK